jgi:hypothetical protein
MRQTDILESIYRAAVVEGVSLNELRQRFGGQDAYLRQTAPAESEHRQQQRARILEDLKRLPVRAVAARHGVSKSTAARLRKLG